MRVTTYKCDGCGGILSDDKVSHPHVHLRGNITIAKPEPYFGQWKDSSPMFKVQETQWHPHCLMKAILTSCEKEGMKQRPDICDICQNTNPKTACLTCDGCDTCCVCKDGSK